MEAPHAKAKTYRTFVDTEGGQVHMRIAPGPPDGGPPLVLLHHSPSSGFIFEPALEGLARRRTVYAPDTPGYGESFRPAREPDIGDYADALIEAIEGQVSGPIDLLGYHTGASIAVDWALKRPSGVRRLILLGAPLFTPQVREAMLGRRWPGPPQADGSHLISEWRMVMDNHRLPISLEDKSRIFHEMFRGGDTAWWGGAAVGRHDLEGALAQIRVPTLILETADYLKGSGEKIAALVPGSRWMDWQHLGHGLFQGATREVVATIDGFLAP